MQHIVMFSGGVGSWAAAKRVVERHGAQQTRLLFTDTLMEDEDLYRFLDEGAANVGAPLVKIADGRTPWQVFHDVRFLGNTRVDPCSQHLKRKMAKQWLDANCDPADTRVHVGIDWTEEHRFVRLEKRWRELGWIYEAPLLDPPISKHTMLEWLEAEGIKPPRLYALGYPHNNCGGFCIKAGQAHFKLLLRTLPERYAFHERQEQEIRAVLGDVSILRDRRGGETRPLTLRDLRRRVEQSQPIDEHEWGGCGCFLDDGDGDGDGEAEG